MIGYIHYAVACENHITRSYLHILNMAEAEERNDEKLDIFKLIEENDVETIKAQPKSFIEESWHRRNNGKTPLILASEKDHTELAKYLIENTEYLDR